MNFRVKPSRALRWRPRGPREPFRSVAGAAVETSRMRLTFAALAVSAVLFGSAPSMSLWDLLSGFWAVPSTGVRSMPAKEGSRWDPDGLRKAGSRLDPNGSGKAGSRLDPDGLTLPAPPPPSDAGSRWDPNGLS